MPKFFFDVHDGDHLYRDEEGSELPDQEAARTEALGALPEIARGKSLDRNRRDVVVDVRNGAGRVIFTATLSLVARWIDEAPLPGGVCRG